MGGGVLNHPVNRLVLFCLFPWLIINNVVNWDTPKMKNERYFGKTHSVIPQNTYVFAILLFQESQYLM